MASAPASCFGPGIPEGFLQFPSGPLGTALASLAGTGCFLQACPRCTHQVVTEGWISLIATTAMFSLDT